MGTYRLDCPAQTQGSPIQNQVIDLFHLLPNLMGLCQNLQTPSISSQLCFFILKLAILREFKTSH